MSNYHLYLGKAGHLTVMSEFLIRGWNVAIPEVDIGDDIFVVHDKNGDLRRVQVKTATANEKDNSYSGQFNIPLNQLQNISGTKLIYVFLVRKKDSWTKPVIISQNDLFDFYQAMKIVSNSKGLLNIYFSYSQNQVKWRGMDLSKYLSDFTHFPIIEG